MADHGYLRKRLVRELGERGIRDPRVLEAMGAVPRHLFVRSHLASQSYSDCALPIGEEQTISQPWVVARMTELLAVEPGHSVLELGTGTGYQTAILAYLAGRVYSLERIPTLARQATQRMRDLKLDNVKVQAFDGTVGWSDVAPFDRILVTAGAPRVPPPLFDQLVDGGRLVIPVGDRESQRLAVYERRGERFHSSFAERVTFVPLIGRHGWQENAQAGSEEGNAMRKSRR